MDEWRAKGELLSGVRGLEWKHGGLGGLEQQQRDRKDVVKEATIRKDIPLGANTGANQSSSPSQSPHQHSKRRGSNRGWYQAPP